MKKWIPVERQPLDESRPEDRLSEDALSQLDARVVACRRCDRLRTHCEKVARERKKKWKEFEYWSRPVPSFGDPGARLLIVGLAPAAHGSNRTGRMFTGDGSGDFLYPVLHEAGFASQPTAMYRGDGLELRDARITAVVRCAPPGNKPTRDELAACAPFLDEETAALTRLKVIVCLGRIGFDGVVAHLTRMREIASRSGLRFGHGVCYQLPGGRCLMGSYHPSLQNTNTGRLTHEMMLEVFLRARDKVEGIADMVAS